MPAKAPIAKLFSILALAALGLAGGCIQVPEPPGASNLTPLEKRGWQIFRREPCFLSCHVETIVSVSPQGSTGFVPDLRKTPRRTRDWYLAYLVYPRAVLPSSPMPSFGYLPSEEFEALIAFLQRLNKGVPVPSPESAPTEAVPETPKDLAGYEAGRTLYHTYCAGCHSESGNGGGIVGHLLSPEPRDFTDVIWMSKQTEGYLFSAITNGKPDTAMPAFREILSARQRALVLRYVAYFTDPVAKERMELEFVTVPKETTATRSIFPLVGPGGQK